MGNAEDYIEMYRAANKPSLKVCRCDVIVTHML
jgi:hypothetical protein